MNRLADIVDSVAEATIAPSFTRLGYAARSRLGEWTPLGDYDLTGRVVVITGATSGLGLAAAHRVADAGATLVLLGRNPDKTKRARDEIADASGNEDISTVIADMGELTEVRAAAASIAGSHPRVDVLVHNAGALTADRRTNSAGLELTVASQVVGPFLLTGLLLDQLRAAPAPRVLTMSSGGMYTARLAVDGLTMDADDYSGSNQYALAKRAQVTLTEMWAERLGPRGVRFHSLHPGWADTPGVEESLPTFRKVVGPLLRTADQGADTLVWLIADDGEPIETNGLFWHDRRPRDIHRLGSTRRSDTPQRRQKLWDWVVAESGHDPS